MPSTTTSDPSVTAALLHALEVHHAELELQNQELVAANEQLRRTNDELVVARDRFRALHELAPVAFVTVDHTGTIADVNGSAEALLRSPRRRLVGARLPVFFAEASRRTLRAAIADVFDQGEVRGVELTLELEDGAPIDVMIEAVLVSDAAGTSSQCVLAIVDVSAQKRVAEERRALERRLHVAARLESLSVLAGGVAHDFNNLLTVILGGTDLLRTQLGSDAAPALADVLEAAHAARDLAHQMLAFSGHTSTPVRLIDPAQLVHELEPLLRAAAKAVPITIDVRGELPPIEADVAQIRQVLLNLVINASDAMVDRAGGIAIMLREVADQVEIEVADDGVGMAAEAIERIFDPYVSTKGGGRGLGLAVVQGIVRGHRGTVTVRSELGMGTSLVASFPASSSPRPLTTPDAAIDTRTWRATGTVLLVDDDRGVSHAVASILASLGLTVITACDGLDAIEKFEARVATIDLVLMDLTMPRMGGVAAAHALHERSPDLPIVLVTGFGEIPPGAGREFVAALPKPFNIDAVVRVLRPWLRAAS